MRPSRCTMPLLLAMFGYDVETRACNDTSFTLSSLAWGEHIADAALAPGACTSYRLETFDVFSYTNARFTIGDDELRIQVIDHVGDQPLEGGRWSYRITISDYGARRAAIKAIAD